MLQVDCMLASSWYWCFRCVSSQYTRLARRRIAAEEQQPRSALLLFPMHWCRHIPLNLNAVWPRAPTGDFGLIVHHAAARRLQPHVLHGHGERRRSEEHVREPAVCLIRPQMVVPRVVATFLSELSLTDVPGTNLYTILRRASLQSVHPCAFLRR